MSILELHGIYESIKAVIETVLSVSHGLADGLVGESSLIYPAVVLMVVYVIYGVVSYGVVYYTSIKKGIN